MQNIGELYSLLTAFCWTFSALAFEGASKKIGSLSVNLIRLIMALVLISIFTFFSRGLFIPIDASANIWIWLSISGIIGFVVGDLFLFDAFILIGSRLSMLIMTLAPVFTAIIGFFLMNEHMSLIHILGMLLTISGIGLVISFRKKGNKDIIKENIPVKGIVFAVIAAIGQAGGLVLSKYGMGDYDAIAATQIRIIAGILGFIILSFYLKKIKVVYNSTSNKSAMGLSFIGAFFGPFAGVSLSLLAVQNTFTGIASTIMSITPILILPVSFFIFKQKVSIIEILGAIICVLGVSLLFLF